MPNEPNKHVLPITKSKGKEHPLVVIVKMSPANSKITPMTTAEPINIPLFIDYSTSFM